jgi:hypothetical protein
VRKKAPTIFFPTCAPSPKREGKEPEITEETEKNEHKSPDSLFPLLPPVLLISISILGFSTC